MIQSLMRAMDLLEILKDTEKAFSISELSERIALPPSTVHRILQTFCARKYVTKDEVSHLYRLGPALISLGTAASHNLRLQDMAKPILTSLSHSTGEDAFLIIRAGNKGLVLDKVEGANILKVVEKFGSAVDLHCGAIRKALLAYQGDEFIENYIKIKLSPATEITSPTPDELRASLARIRERGVSFSCGDYMLDGIGVGAPVFTIDGSVIASIGIIAPKARIRNEHEAEVTELVKQHAEELSYNMGYSAITGVL
ncbi:MAG: IclR family transcriptional regulator [Pygmaiobacter sp.]